MPLDGTLPEKPRPRLAIYDKVAAVLKTYGWCQGSLQKTTGFCLLGALEVTKHGASFSPTSVPDDWDAFAHGLGFMRHQYAAQWNDDNERRLEHVLDRLDRAARGEFVKETADAV